MNRLEHIFPHFGPPLLMHQDDVQFVRIDPVGIMLGLGEIHFGILDLELFESLLNLRIGHEVMAHLRCHIVLRDRPRHSTETANRKVAPVGLGQGLPNDQDQSAATGWPSILFGATAARLHPIVPRFADLREFGGAAIPARSRRSLLGEVPDDLAYALVVEHHRHAARSREQRHTIPNRQRVGMIHFQSIAIHHRDRERSKWGAVLKRSDCPVESVPVHRALRQAYVCGHIFHDTRGPPQTQHPRATGVPPSGSTTAPDQHSMFSICAS